MGQRDYRQVLSRDLGALLEQGCALVDIRRPEEWQLTGVVSGSLLLTFYDENRHCDPPSWLAALDRLVPQEQPLALICRTGVRTLDACDLLIEETERAVVYNVTDGIFGWLGEGLPTLAPTLNI